MLVEAAPKRSPTTSFFQKLTLYCPTIYSELGAISKKINTKKQGTPPNSIVDGSQTPKKVAKKTAQKQAKSQKNSHK